MQSIRTIAHNDVYLFLRDPSGYVWLVVVPLFFIYFFGAGQQGGDQPQNPRPAVLIENLDQGFMGAQLVQELEAQGLYTIGPDHENATEVKRGLRIPENFTERILAVEPVKVVTFTTDGGSLGADAMVEVRLQRAIIAILSRLTELDNATELGIDEANLKRLAERGDAIPLDIQFAGRKVMPRGFTQSLPGFLVMMILMNLIIFGGVSIAEERQEGVMRRLAVQPMTRGQLILGKIYGRFLLAMAQVAVYALVGTFLIEIPFSGNGLALLVILAIYSWGSAALGVFLGSIILDTSKVVAIGVLSANVLAALGGCWWPLEVAPPLMQQIGAALPTQWALGGLHQILTYGGGWSTIRVELALLTGFAILGTFLAARFLRYEE